MFNNKLCSDDGVEVIRTPRYADDLLINDVMWNEVLTANSSKILYQRSRFVSSTEYGELMIKPTNKTINGNLSKQNIESIIQRLNKVGWTLACLKVTPGEVFKLETLLQLYNQQFAGAEIPDLRSTLTAEEKAKIVTIYGTDALDFPIYHSLRLITEYGESAEELGIMWHKGRGEGNVLLEKDVPNGINKLNTTKDTDLGWKRVFLVHSLSEVNNGRPFFLYNGFLAEMAHKYTHPGAKHISMLFEKGASGCDIAWLRKNIIGETNPRLAVPGSIRRDALEEKTISPIRSLVDVGQENNIIHYSENHSDAQRELKILFPELIVFPEQGSFAPTISEDIWLRNQAAYKDGTLSLKDMAITNKVIESAQKEDVVRYSEIVASVNPEHVPPFSVVLLGGGTGGRMFGYQLPEEQRIKMIAKLFDINGVNYSALQLRGAYLAQQDQLVNIHIMASDLNCQSIADAISADFLNEDDLVSRMHVYHQNGVPRLIPSAEDLRAEKKFVTYCDENKLKPIEYSDVVSTNTGELCYDISGQISTKPPGHLDAFTQYVISQLKLDIMKGSEAVFLNSGEELGFFIDQHILNYVAQGENALYFMVIEGSSGGGGLVRVDGKPMILEKGQIPKQVQLETYYKNTFQVVLNIKNILRELGCNNPTEFLGWPEKKIREVVNQKIYAKLKPIVEIKPLPGSKQWAAQIMYLFGSLSTILPTGYILKDPPYDSFLEVKDEEDLRKVTPLVRDLYKDSLI